MGSHMSGVFSDEANHHGMVYKQIPRNLRKRKCVLCGMQLSDYNNNPACFVHMSKLRKIEEDKKKEKQYKQRRVDARRRDREKSKRAVRVQVN